MEALPLYWWAPLAGIAYTATSLAGGEIFPFSRYRLYSKAAKRETGAVPFFAADGSLITLDQFRMLGGFKGIDPAAIYPLGIPCSMESTVEEARRWISTHQAPAVSGPGPTRVALGFFLISIDSAGRLSQKAKVVATGTAWPR